MKPQIPLCCSPAAYQLMSRQVDSIESPDALLVGAVAIAMHEMPDADVHRTDRMLQSYAETIRSRVRGSQPQALLAHLHEFLFDEQNFGGNTESYYDAENSYLPAVLKSKVGLPITLSAIYKIVAERIGLRCWGVGLPGHFLVGLDLSGSMMLIDPFDRGRALTPDEAHDRMRETFGEEVEWTDDLLHPISNTHWLTRMLQNLLHVFGAGQRYMDLAAMLEMEMLLWPGQVHLQRDLALVLARVGQSHAASQWLNQYLSSNPDDPQKTDLEQLLEVLSA